MVFVKKNFYCSFSTIFNYMIQQYRSMFIGQEKHQFHMDISFTDQGLSQQQPEALMKKVTQSIFNKVCMHSLNISNTLIQQLPNIKDKDNLQKLNISNNYITCLPVNLPNLKQLIASNNHIKNIPDNINIMTRLRILNVESNQIKIVPYLKYVSHLYIRSNPIKLMTSKIAEMSLQQFQMDWVDFFVPTFNGNSLVSFLQIVKKISSDKNCPSFIDFSRLFNTARPMPRQVEILAMFWRSIVKHFNFFIQHVRNEIINNQRPYKQINFNDARHLGTSLLQYAFQSKNEQALSIFTQKKTNLNSPQVLYNNLILACRYGHLQYFTFLIKHSLKKKQIFQTQKIFIDEILRNFDINNGGLQIIKIILAINHQGEPTKYRLNSPQSYINKQIDAIGNGIYAMLTEPQIIQYLDISQKGYQSQVQPLFHFAMYSRNFSLIQYMLINEMNPFIPNIKCQVPRVIKTCGIGRKLLWKYQKKLINKQIQQQIEKESQINSFCVHKTMQLHNSDSIFAKLRLRRNKKNIITTRQLSSATKQDEMCITRLGGSANKKKHERQSSGEIIKWNSIDMQSFAKNDLRSSIKLQRSSYKQEQLRFQESLQGFETFQKLLLKEYEVSYNSYLVQQKQTTSSLSSILFCQDIQTCKQEQIQIQTVGLIRSRRRFHKL